MRALAAPRLVAFCTRARVRALLIVLAAGLAACAGELPQAIRDELTATARVKAGAATVVFFTDFQCPYCRSTHQSLAPLLAARGDRVRLVLRHVPLPMHPDAKDAARAAICVEKLAPQVAEAYAHALFESPDLSPAACSALAVERGVDRPRYEACLFDPATDARITRDEALFDAVGGDGVPLLYVGKARLEGAQTAAALAEALDAATP
jgi:protein-disulfide isomerase